MMECPSEENVLDKHKVNRNLTAKLHKPRLFSKALLAKPKPQKPKAEDSDDSSFEAILPKKKYHKISNEKRLELIDCVGRKGENIKQVAKRLHINYSSAKSIFKVFKKEGRTNKKTSKIRTGRDIGNELAESNLNLTDTNTTDNQNIEQSNILVQDETATPAVENTQETSTPKDTLAMLKDRLLQSRSQITYKTQDSTENIVKKELLTFPETNNNYYAKINHNLNNGMQPINCDINHPNLLIMNQQGQNISNMQVSQQSNISSQPTYQFGYPSATLNSSFTTTNIPGQLSIILPQTTSGPLGGLVMPNLMVQNSQMQQTRIATTPLSQGLNMNYQTTQTSGTSGQLGQKVLSLNSYQNYQLNPLMIPATGQVYYQLGSFPGNQAISPYPQLIQPVVYMMAGTVNNQANLSAQNLSGQSRNNVAQPNAYILLKGDQRQP